MGNLALSQLAWNQNSAARINNGAMWNQLIMTAVMTAQLFNQRTLQTRRGASAAANALTFRCNQGHFHRLRSELSTPNALTVQRPATH